MRVTHTFSDAEGLSIIQEHFYRLCAIPLSDATGCARWKCRVAVRSGCYLSARLPPRGRGDWRVPFSRSVSTSPSVCASAGDAGLYSAALGGSPRILSYTIPPLD